MAQKKTSHGVICPDCGSPNVVIRNTRTHRYAENRCTSTRMIRRECVCRRCGRTWWRRSRVMETVLEEE